jgi:hypothetical protein
MLDEPIRKLTVASTEFSEHDRLRGSEWDGM